MLAFKYLPVLAMLILTIHTGLLFFGVHVRFMAVSFGTSFINLLVLTAASYAFKFCAIHRIVILYCFWVSFCVNYQAAVGFGTMRHPLQGLTCVVGITLLIIVLRKGICVKK